MAWWNSTVRLTAPHGPDEQAEIYGGCGPRLNEEKDAEWWYANGGAKPKLENEKPQGQTVNYDELVARWAEN